MIASILGAANIWDVYSASSHRDKSFFGLRKMNYASQTGVCRSSPVTYATYASETPWNQFSALNTGRP